MVSDNKFLIYFEGMHYQMIMTEFHFTFVEGRTKLTSMLWNITAKFTLSNFSCYSEK